MPEHILGRRLVAQHGKRERVALITVVDDRGIGHAGSLGEAERGLVDAVDDRGVDGLQQGDDIESHLVALDIVDKIGAVGDISLALLAEPLFDVAAAHGEQRTHHMTIAGSDAGESVDAGTPDEIEEHGLDAVFAMVGHTHGGGTDGKAQLLEITITQIACSHLYAHLMEVGIGTGVKVGKMKRDGVTATEVDAELLIAIGLVATEVEVAVSRLNMITQPSEHQQQTNAVGATREGYQMCVARRQEVMGGDELAYFFIQHRVPVPSGIHPRGDRY